VDDINSRVLGFENKGSDGFYAADNKRSLGDKFCRPGLVWGQSCFTGEVAAADVLRKLMYFLKLHGAMTLRKTIRQKMHYFKE